MQAVAFELQAYPSTHRSGMHAPFSQMLPTPFANEAGQRLPGRPQLDGSEAKGTAAHVPFVSLYPLEHSLATHAPAWHAAPAAPVGTRQTLPTLPQFAESLATLMQALARADHA
ncbi:hypothetical protein NBRC10513_003341 [Rhodotorula toruloides]